jgi:hypothetical protein
VVDDLPCFIDPTNLGIDYFRCIEMGWSCRKKRRPRDDKNPLKIFRKFSGDLGISFEDLGMCFEVAFAHLKAQSKSIFPAHNQS